MLVNEKMASISTDLEEGVEPSGFLSNVLAAKKLSMEEVHASVSELLAAAVDTVSSIH